MFGSHLTWGVHGGGVRGKKSIFFSLISSYDMSGVRIFGCWIQICCKFLGSHLPEGIHGGGVGLCGVKGNFFLFSPISSCDMYKVRFLGCSIQIWKNFLDHTYLGAYTRGGRGRRELFFCDQYHHVGWLVAVYIEECSTCIRFRIKLTP